MRQAYKYSILLLLLSSCLTSRNAPKRQYDIATKFPAVLAEAAAKFIPAKPPVYIKGDTDTVTEIRILTDSIAIACPPNLKDTLIVRIPGSTVTRTVTINRTDTLEVDAFAYERADLRERLFQKEKELALSEANGNRLKEGRNLWRIIALSALSLLALIFAFKVKSFFTPSLKK